jgi:hypothetical protein
MHHSSSDPWLRHRLYWRERTEKKIKKIRGRRRWRQLLIFIGAFAIFYYYGRLVTAVVVGLLASLAAIDGGEGFVALLVALALYKLAQLVLTVWRHCRRLARAALVLILTVGRATASYGSARRDPWLDRPWDKPRFAEQRNPPGATRATTEAPRPARWP